MSPFMTTTHKSFRDLQEHWHKETEEMFNELRTNLPRRRFVDLLCRGGRVGLDSLRTGAEAG